MKNTKNISSILYCISAVCFYIASAIEFFSGDETTMAIMHLCLGSTFLCLAAVNRNKDNADASGEGSGNNAPEEDKKDEENK